MLGVETEAVIDALVTSVTIEEKASLTAGAGSVSARGARIGMPALKVSDGRRVCVATA